MPSILLVTSGIPQRGKERGGKEGENKEEIQANVNFFALATLINLAPKGNFHLSPTRYNTPPLSPVPRVSHLFLLGDPPQLVNFTFLPFTTKLSYKICVATTRLAFSLCILRSTVLLCPTNSLPALYIFFSLIFMYN